MEDRDLLLTVAEVATAFAGFATLAAVFTSRNTQDAQEQIAVRFQTLLIYSLTTIGFCFIPFIPGWYGYSTAASWCLSTWLLGISIACINLWMIRHNRAAVAMVSKSQLIPWILMAWAPVLLAGLAVVGIGTNAANFRVALLSTLFLSAGAFIRVISSITRITQES